jgi:hypothetical protein
MLGANAAASNRDRNTPVATVDERCTSMDET